MKPTRQYEATLLFNKTFFGSIKKWTLIYPLRPVVEAGLPLAREVMTQQYSALFTSITSEPDLVDIFEGLSEEKLAEAELRMMDIESDMKNATLTASAGSLIFTHAVLDDIALSYLKVIAIAEPKDWLVRVGTKTATLNDINARSFEEMLDDAIKKELEGLERASLLTKLDLLYALCRPDANFPPIRGFTYDRNRIERLDKLRHGVIHGDALQSLGEIPQDDINYLKTTATHLMTLVNRRYGLKLFPQLMNHPEVGITHTSD